MRAFRLCVLLSAAIAAGAPIRSVAQDLLAPPPDLSMDEIGELPRSLLRPNSGLGLPSEAITRGQAEQIEPGLVLDPVPEDQMMIYDPAEVWSSRSWLDRGYWYVVDEVVVTNRLFDRRNVLLSFTPPDQFGRAARSLQIRTGHPGAVANARLTLGRFLFRDTENRDHLLETTFFGFGKETQRDAITALTANSLITNFQLTTGNPAFNGSNSQSLSYTHELESLEFNYRVRQRMDRDWMILRPNGQWVREASPGLLYEYQGGIRWLSADEWLDWDAAGNRNGSMNVKANNDLLGLQLGAGGTHSFDRWEFGVKGVAGAYVNFARVNRDFTLRDNAAIVTDDSVRAEEEDLSFLGDFQATIRYHIHQNFSFRFGYEVMYIDGMAVAPFQLTFMPNFNHVGLSGSSLYQGFLLGIDGYW